MSHVHRLLLVIASVFVLLLIAVPPRSRAAGTAYYVATSGADTNPGTLAAPFRTIQKAAAVAKAGDTVFVRAGTYRETVTPANSGLAGAPIAFQPFNNEAVTVSGAVAVPPAGWTQDGARWYTAWPGAYASATNQSDQVFVDGAMVDLARWPQETNHNLSFPFTATVDRIVSAVDTGKQAPGPGYPIYRVTFIDAAFDQPDGRWDGAQIWLNTGGATPEQDGNGQSGVVITTNLARHELVVEIDAGAATGDATPQNFQIGNGSAFYLFDPPTADGLVSDGAFWHDRAANRLYLRTADGSAPGGHTVEVKQRDYAFDLSNTHDLSISGLRIFAASITTDAAAGDGKGNGGLRIDVAPASNIVLDGLDFTYVTHFTDQTGNIQTQWAQAAGVILSGTQHTIRNCRIAWSAGNGLVVIGRGHTVFNTTIHDTNYTAAEGGGINLGRSTAVTSEDHDVGYNMVYNSGLEGIEFSALRNASGAKSAIRARIHHNVVYNTVLQSAHSGGIKAYASDGGWARIDHNIIYNTGGPDVAAKYIYYGIYFDFPKATGEYVVDHNVVYNTPSSMNINGMKNMDIFNNTFIARPEIARGPLQANGTLENIVIRNLLSNRELRLPSGGVIQSNVVLTAAETGAWFVDAQNADLAKRSYQLAAGATAAINTGADVAPFNDATPPDIGAYEFGAAPWQAGATDVPPPTPATPTPATSTPTTPATPTACATSAASRTPAATPVGTNRVRLPIVVKAAAAGGC